MSKELKNQAMHIRSAENSILRFVIKTIIVLAALALQIGTFVVLFRLTGAAYTSSFAIYNVVRVMAVIYILSKHDSALYKLVWLLILMFLPVLGISIYILWGNSRLRRKKQIDIKDIENDTNYLLDTSFKLDETIKSKDKHVYNMLKYIQNITSYPVCKNISSKYYDLGDKVFVDLKEDLKKAKHYIFLEFYIIDKGKLSSEIFEILKTKAKEGLDVRIIYDSYGCIGKFTKKMKKDLTESGVKVYSFNPLTLFVNSYFNNRLHRKVIAIDGKISYTGGFNLADEYANIKEKYGHWKDNGIRFEGEVSWNFTLLFLRDLKLINKKIELDLDKYKEISKEDIEPEDYSTREVKEYKGIAVGFSDGPNNRKNPVEAVYMNIINNATDYVYITTPYFAISEEMLTCILNAARSGVDVRIIMPHIPDKKIVQLSTRSYYEVLLSAGVKVYEYRPGFIHSKTFVSDDKTAVVGSANMDYRSMNLNYECISLIYDTGTELDIKEDMINMINNSCIELELKKWIKRPLIFKIIESILTTFSTLF